jgi:hypothetical protein
LRDKRVNALRRFRGRAFGLIKRGKMIFEHVRDGLVLVCPRSRSLYPGYIHALGSCRRCLPSTARVCRREHPPFPHTLQIVLEDRGCPRLFRGPRFASKRFR